MGAMASQITSPMIVYSSVYSGADKKKTSKLRVTGLCVGSSPVTGEFPAQMASNAENVSIWWRHHGPPDSRFVQGLTRLHGSYHISGVACGLVEAALAMVDGRWSNRISTYGARACESHTEGMFAWFNQTGNM